MVATSTNSEEPECAMCLGNFVNPYHTPCFHTFNRECLDSLVTKEPSDDNRRRVVECPLCRHRFRICEIRPGIAPAAAASNVVRPSAGSNVVRPSAQQPLLQGDPSNHAGESSHFAARTRALVDLGAPAGIARCAAREATSTAMRVYLLDNSGSTGNFDGKTMHFDNHTGQWRLQQASRWDEIKCLAIAHAEWNAALGISAEFHLLNTPPGKIEGQQGHSWVQIRNQQDITELRTFLNATHPRGGTPIARRLQDIQRLTLAPKLPQLQAEGKQVFFVLVTDGAPTRSLAQLPATVSGHMHDGAIARAEVVSELKKMERTYPMTLIVRLATDEDQVVKFWNNLDDDEELALDVLDDLVGEAEEVAQAGNTFFPYTPWLHRFREAGTINRVFDILDERRLQPAQAAFFAASCILGLGDDGEPVPQWQDPAFIAAVRTRADSIRREWDPRRRQVLPAVNHAIMERHLAGKTTTGPLNKGVFLLFLCLVIFRMLYAFVMSSGSTPITGRR